MWDSTERPFTDRKDGPCCDGTLAFAAPPTMPCSSFQCCQSVEDVVVYPVNHALGYEFRCIVSIIVNNLTYWNSESGIVSHEVKSLLIYYMLQCHMVLKSVNVSKFEKSLKV